MKVFFVHRDDSESDFGNFLKMNGATSDVSDSGYQADSPDTSNTTFNQEENQEVLY